MGHIRLKRLPATRKWERVVELLASGASTEEIAGASADAAEHALERARRDPALAHSLWLLARVPLAARAPAFGPAARELSLNVSDDTDDR